MYQSVDRHVQYVKTSYKMVRHEQNYLSDHRIEESLMYTNKFDIEIGAAFKLLRTDVVNVRDLN